MRNMKRNVQQGFTLIELMIVIAIVAILVALAVPAYKDYTVRAKVGECINGAAVGKLQVSEYYMTVGTWPANANEAGIGGTAGDAGDTQYCEPLVYGSNGSFTVPVNETEVGISSGTIEPIMVPTVNSQTISGVDWRCTRGNTTATEYKYLPSTCRGT